MDDDPNEFSNDASSMFFSKGKVITRDANGNVIVKDRHAAGRNISPGRGNQGVMVLCIVLGIVLFFLIGNYILYTYAQKTLPQDMKKKKKKPVSKKKMKRERLKQGLSTPAD